jgi:hypothetical protein
MAYRINAQFKDGSTNGPLADIVAATPPHCGDTLSISRRGQPVAVRVIAVWTPSLPPSNRVAETLIVVEAREI